jgi:ATP-grasp domain/L-amino acid ligase C-terminal domain 2/ATP-grasp N-terminal domain
LKRILILSTTTGYQLRSFGAAAAELGFELVFATDRCHQIDDPWRDAAVAVRFHDEPASVAAIASVAAGRPIDGVIAVGDRPVSLAACAAGALGLRWHSTGGAAASANKQLARERFAAAGLPVPAFEVLGASDSAEPVLRGVRFPVVVKPLGLSGSRGVIRADSAADLTAALTRVRALLARPDIRAQRTGLDDTILVEAFIPGREYAVEGVLTGGRLQAFAIFDKPEPLDGPFFEETIYVTPSGQPDSTQAAVLEAISRGAAALGLANGPVHAECRVNETGVFLLEIAARPIGGLCSKVLRFHRAGASHAPTISLERVLLEHAAGRDVTDIVREPGAAGVMMIPIPMRGLLKRVDGQDEARAVPAVEEVTITAKPDQLLEPLPEAGSYLGFIFARAESPAAVVSALNAAHGRLGFRIDAAIPVLGAAAVRED